MIAISGFRLRSNAALVVVAFAIVLGLGSFGGSSLNEVRGQTTAKSPIPLPQPFTPIVDYAHVIDPETKQKLEAIYLNLKQRADIEFAVVTVPTTGDRDIFEYSLDIARAWGIGSKGGEKNGFLLVVAINDRKYFTQVSDHLEGDLSDGVVGQIQRERLVPQFKKANYSQGIDDTIKAYIATLGEKRNFSIEGIDQSYAYREPQEGTPSRSGGLPGGCCTLLIIIFVGGLILMSMRRGGRGGRGGGGGGLINALLWGSLINSVTRGGGSSSSGWGGGGFGGGGGGFGGGFGGGGSFGGGGAGGSW